MTDAKLAAIVCLCVLAVSAGCTERNVPADAEIVVKNASVQGEQVRLNVVAWLDGGTHNVTVHDAAVVFVADNGSTVRTKHLGTLGDPPNETYEAVRFNATFAQPPKQIRWRFGEVENPDNISFSVRGAKRVGEYPPKYT